jgi:hypothetical protein
MAQKRTEDEIEELLQRYDARGNVTRRAFCESQDIPVSTLGYYLRRRAAPAVHLARVKLTNGVAAGAGRFALVLGNGRRIECGPAELAHLISAAERA